MLLFYQFLKTGITFYTVICSFIGMESRFRILIKEGTNTSFLLQKVLLLPYHSHYCVFFSSILVGVLFLVSVSYWYFMSSFLEILCI